MTTHPSFSLDWVCRHGPLCPTTTSHILCLLLPLSMHEEETEKEGVCRHKLLLVICSILLCCRGDCKENMKRMTHPVLREGGVCRHKLPYPMLASPLHKSSMLRMWLRCCTCILKNMLHIAVICYTCVATIHLCSMSDYTSSQCLCVKTEISEH